MGQVSAVDASRCVAWDAWDSLPQKYEGGKAMARQQLYQCENCKDYMDYEGTYVDLKMSGIPDRNFVRWCDDCLAKVKQRATVDKTKPTEVSA